MSFLLLLYVFLNELMATFFFMKNECTSRNVHSYRVITYKWTKQMLKHLKYKMKPCNMISLPAIQVS